MTKLMCRAGWLFGLTCRSLAVFEQVTCCLVLFTDTLASSESSHHPVSCVRYWKCCVSWVIAPSTSSYPWEKTSPCLQGLTRSVYVGKKVIYAVINGQPLHEQFLLLRRAGLSPCSPFSMFCLPLSVDVQLVHLGGSSCRWWLQFRDSKITPPPPCLLSPHILPPSPSLLSSESPHHPSQT